MAKKGRMPAGLARYMAAKKAGGTKTAAKPKSGGSRKRTGMNHPKFRARMGNPKGRSRKK